MHKHAPDRYAVLGNPVAHSHSPWIHAQFAQQTGQDLSYERLLCPLDDFSACVRGYADSGASGCNITVPFKFEVPQMAHTLTDRAALAQAANTLRFDAGGWAADNTDGVGLVRDIEVNAAQPLRGRRVLLIGAGGAAAGVLGPLLMAQPAALRVVNRTVARAQALVARHSALAKAQGVALDASTLDEAQAGVSGGWDIVINGTASSLGGAGVPVSAAVLAPGALALDMMYGTAAQGFLDWSHAHGARGRDGLGMLVEQAAEAFVFWRGVRPQTAPVLAALRERLQSKT